MSNKLHEILAIEQDRKNKANQSIGESKKTFSKGSAVFDGMIKKYISTEEFAEQIPDESKELVTTVKKTLEDTLTPVIVAIDATLSKEETNSSGVAQAELKLGDKVFGTYSATTLLALESHLTKVLDLYKSIPTLDTTRKWFFDEQNDFYRTEEEVKFRTIKRPKVIVKYEATDKHPAQTELLNIDFQVGKYETTYFSGRLTPIQRNRLVDKLERLIEAVKIARSKANNVEVKQIKLGQDIFDFIHNEIL
ncbi:MAG: hypothetical protein HRU41_20745 [Saprospiraceae bacterium]|nr:hypothetical protein [Saprospiraceae bacterium]